MIPTPRLTSLLVRLYFVCVRAMVFTITNQCVIFGDLFLSQITSLQYASEEFPLKYLEPDGIVPSRSDLELYLDTLMRLTKYLIRNANETDVNQALSAYMSAAILKRTLKDYSNKLEPYKQDIKFMINGLTHVIAHYRYNNNGRKHPEYSMTRAVEDYTALVHSLRKFNKGVMKEWLLKYNPINNFTLAMDDLSLPKERYVQLVEDINGAYEITGASSDLCLSRLAENIDVLDNTTLHPCKTDELCKMKIFSAPSVAYSLTHRLLNNMMYYNARRCYHHSPTYDVSHMDMLCAAMYREAVYIARRGYFSRDVFMEHVGFCGQLGYEEFHRHTWFRKTAKWIDETGCMQEDENFELNRTKLIISSIKDPKEVRAIWRKYQELINEDCHLHQMAVALMVLSTAVRHAAHFMEDPIENLI